MMAKEKLTYEILEQRFKEQDRLITEGKMQKHNLIIRDFTPEEQTEFDKGITWEHIFANKKNNAGDL
jgi:hypothetical protein